MAWADKGVSLKTRAHQDKLGRMTDDSPASSQGVSHEDAPGLGISAFISVGLFALPWLLALLVGVWADLQPANDIVVELYEPLEAVYLQLDPPADEESELEVAEDGLVADEEIDGDPDLVADTEPEPPSEDLPDEDPGGSKGGEGDAGVEDPEADGSAGEGGTDEGDGEGDGEGEGVGDGSGDGEGHATPKRRRRTRSQRCAKPHPNVRKGADGIMEVDRSLVEYYTKSLERFMELGYSEPYEREGIKGFYVGGFGCTSPVYKAGFRRGDMLITVNGKKTRTWIGVFLLYKKLRKQTDFEVVLLRRGDEKPRTMHFRIVD